MSLAVAVNSSEQSWTLTADLVVGTRFLKVGSEVVAVIANFPSSVYAPTGEVTPPSVRVERAVGSTSAASHSQGAAITEYADESAFAGAGGATPDIAAVLAEGNDAEGAAADNFGRVTLTDDGAASLTVPGIIRRPSNPGNIGDGVPAAAGTVCVCDDGTVYLKLSSEDDADWDVMVVGNVLTEPPTLAQVLTAGAIADMITITSLGPPVDPEDAANKDYVDDAITVLSGGEGFALATANPGPGILWNDGGTVKVGT